MLRRFLAGLLVAGLAAVPGPEAYGQEQPPSVGLYDQVELVPAPGTVLTWRDRRYAGRLEVRGAGDGLIVVEHVAPEEYLLGIQEVPFSWPDEALKAQAVAARTYLAWTLDRGRAGAGATYGFDICATTACQVYGGLDQVQGPDGGRWASAVQSTAGEVLLYEGSPAQALYSSTTGGRTRAVQDVFGGRAVPYLQAVESPGEPSPYVDWEFEVSGSALGAILREAGTIEGHLVGMDVQKTSDGTGPWMVEIRHRGGVERLSTWALRGVMNRFGPRVWPDLLPALRPDGRKYPQTVLSPTYTIDKSYRYPSEFRSGFIVVEETYRFSGNGWGHLVGLSQYGAKAMADLGSPYGQILSHYYTGLSPVVAPEVLPTEIAVGLVWGEDELSVSADGPISVLADGTEIAAEVLGTWRFEARAGDVAAFPPEGLGLPPSLRDLRPEMTTPAGSSVVVTATLAAPAEVRLVVFRGGRVVGETPWRLREAGGFALAWDGSVGGAPAPPATYRVLVEARSPEGSAHAFVTLHLRLGP